MSAQDTLILVQDLSYRSMQEGIRNSIREATATIEKRAKERLRELFAGDETGLQRYQERLRGIEARWDCVMAERDALSAKRIAWEVVS